jgi:hypothetical protein
LFLVAVWDDPSGLGVELLSGLTATQIGNMAIGVVVSRTCIGEMWWCSMAVIVAVYLEQKIQRHVARPCMEVVGGSLASR